MNTYPQELKELAEQYKNKKTSNLTRWKPPIYLKLLEWTKFLPQESSATQRLFHVENDIFEIPRCKNENCDNRVNWINEYKPPRYADFCSTKCTANSKDVISKKRKTNKEKYGVESYSQTDEFKTKIKSIDKEVWDDAYEKRKQTNVERYGTEHAHLTPEAIEKRKQTNFERFGHENVLASNYVKEIKREKYGTEHYVTVPEFKEKRKKTMIEKYGVEYSGQSKLLNQKRNKTINEKYGVDYFSQSHISKNSLNLLNNKNWLLQNHHIDKKTITRISEMLQVDRTTVSNYFKKHNIEILNFPKSTAEKEISNLLTEHDIPHETNIRSIIPPYELDIYIPEKNLAIEFCGLYWHSTAVNSDKNYHLNKTLLCKKKGIRLITIFEDEWVHKQNIIKNKLVYMVGQDKNKSVYARLCEVCIVDNKTKKAFFETNHIQGDGPSSINLALKYKDEIVACIGFIKQKNKVYNLNRYATSKKVIGGFSKLLKYFQKNYDWNDITTFADLRWSEGDLYEQTGFTLEKTLAPDYYYVDLKNIERLHKFNFRHKNLSNILENYDPNLSETENTIRNNWYRIYNCGLKKYVIRNN
jgi:hypothetical protein